jgi:DNA excision repair protein ERCC-2
MDAVAAPPAGARVSVRRLVDFVHQKGGLAAETDFVSPLRAQQGARLHRSLQANRGEGFEAEVPLSCVVSHEELTLEVQGRADGVWHDGGKWWVEEIKSDRSVNLIRDADPLHLGQARMYAHLLLLARGGTECSVRIRYVTLDGAETRDFEYAFTAAGLREFFEGTVRPYLSWLIALQRWKALRNESIAVFPFPFETFRRGQRQLAVKVYRAARDGAALLAEAPTGTGKTISALYPSIKALGEGGFGTVVFLAAKTAGKRAAEEAVARMKAQGLRLRHVTLTARDKVCQRDGVPCDRTACPLAVHYYDRIPEALAYALEDGNLGRDRLREIGERFGVCPFELSLDAACWIDVLICDYNYIFDPVVFLRRLFGECADSLFLIVDEAHHLPERVRSMLSAELSAEWLGKMKRLCREEVPGFARELGRLRTLITKQCRESFPSGTGAGAVAITLPPKLAETLRNALDAAEEWLVQEIPSLQREEILEAYFKLLSMQRALGWFNESFAALLEKRDGGPLLRIACLDPAFRIKEVLEETRGATFLSATLSPIEEYRTVLAEDAATLQLDSPYPQDHLRVLIHDRIDVRFKAREGSIPRIVEAIAAFVDGRAGNYMVYAPSYAYLASIHAAFCKERSNVETMIQTPDMSETAREAFVHAFQPGRTTALVGFAVLGGVFGEGIDLAGDRLNGVVVVGAGLGYPDAESELIRSKVEESGSDGFFRAYIQPAMTRVLQAVGRLIRSETDRGVALMIDRRFGQPAYARLFPHWWRPFRVASASGVRQQVDAFWRNVPAGQEPCKSEISRIP